MSVQATDSILLVGQKKGRLGFFNPSGIAHRLQTGTGGEF